MSVWGAEAFGEHLAVASNRLGVSAFALAILPDRHHWMTGRCNVRPGRDVR